MSPYCILPPPLYHPRPVLQASLLADLVEDLITDQKELKSDEVGVITPFYMQAQKVLYINIYVNKYKYIYVYVYIYEYTYLYLQG